MFNPFDISGKTFLITGATSGIGRQLAIDITKLGGKVVITGRNVEKLRSTYDALENSDSCIMEVFDLSIVKDIGPWIKKICKDNAIKLDGFVHCAGINFFKPLRILDVEDINRIFDINYTSGIELLKNVSNPRISNRGSSFVILASVAGIVGEPGILAYSGTKGAIVSSVRTAALELSKFGYRVNSISPGFVDTPMNNMYDEYFDEEQKSNLISKFPLGIGQTEDISNAAIFLLSQGSKWITGTNLIIDGGYTCGK